MKTTLLISIIILVFFLLGDGRGTAQPSIQWQNTIGGNSTDFLLYNSIQQTSDGGYVLGGYSSSNISGDKNENSQGGADYWVVKLDTLGGIQWQNTIGGSGNDFLYSIQQTSDGGYVLGGLSESPISGDKTENSQGGSDYWVVKLDTSGTIQWQNTIGGSLTDALYSIQQTSDGGYVLGGKSDSPISGDKTESSQGANDYWVVKLDSSGAIQWQNTIGGSSDDYLNSIQQTSDGGYILGGWSDSPISGDKTENSQGVSDYWVVKLDASGTIQWQNTIGGSNNDRILSIQQTNDGGYILGGWSDSPISGDKTENSQGVDDYWVVKLDASGTIQWQNTIGGSSSDVLRSIQQTSDGGYILGGYSNSNASGDKTENSQGALDYWVVKLDTSGSIQWQNTIGGNLDDYLASIQQTSDGGYILGGRSQSNASGDKTENSQGGYDYWVVKLLCVTDTTNTGQIICAGDSLLLPGGTYADTAGTYYNTLTNINGCDSIIITTLTVDPTITGSQTIAICAGDSVVVGTSVYNSTGVYTDVFTASNGCDSTFTTNLTVDPAITESQTLAICAEDSVVVGTSVYNTTGVYTDIFTASNGCDSTFTTNLTVDPAITGSQTLTICTGQSVTVGTSTYTTSGTYTDVFTASNGCDSTVTTNLTVNNCTGIENFEFINSFKIYPNPNTGEFNIEMNITQIESFELIIFNNLGQEIFTEKLKQFKGIYEKQLDLNKYPVGIYNLQLITDKGVINKQIIIE